MHKIKIMFVCLFILIPVFAVSFAIKGPEIYSENGKPVKIVSADIPYFLILDEKQQERIFISLKDIGINYLKILACFNGDREYAFQPSPGKFNEKMFVKLDRTLDMATKYGILLTIGLADNNSTYGGNEVYRQWFSGSNDNIFFKDRISIENHKKFISKIIKRKNTINGKYYYNDSQIFAWDLCNELEDTDDRDGKVIYSWINEIASYIKAMDDKHFIIVSKKTPDISEEKINDFDIGMISNIDFIVYGANSTDDIVKYNKIYFENINKPVSLATDLKIENITTIPDTFFKNKGSVLFIKNIDIENKEIIEKIKMIKETLKTIKETLKTIKETRRLILKEFIISPATDSVKIKINFEEPSEGFILYGQSLPLTQKKEFSKGKDITITIDGLQSETRYMYIIKAKSEDKAYVSNIKTFTTLKLKRLTSVPFKMSNNFIKAKDGSFYDGNRKYKYVGANNYYIRHKDKKLIDEIFRQAANAGIKVIRVGSNGEAESMDSIDKREKNRFFRIGPDYFNEEAYREFDYVLDSAARHNIRVIIHFTDNWEYYGGVKVYTKWAGLTNKNQFWIDETCKKFYKQTIDSFIKRKNTVNGRLYKNDPAIFAYDLMNEPRNEDDPTGVTLANWIDEMSTYIKSIDPNHMVTTGMEGFFLRDDGKHYSGSDFILCHRPKNIDFCTYHIYPASEYNNFSMSTTEWLIKRYIDKAHNELKKPVVMEEFGIPNNNPDFPKARWIEFMMDTFFKNGGDGLNYWFFIDPDYHFGDGNEVNWSQTEYMNIFIKAGNIINKEGY